MNVAAWPSIQALPGQSATPVHAAACLVSACLVILLLGCLDDMPGKPDPKDRPELPSQQTDFQILFLQNCAGCHGHDGTLGPAPPLNDPLFLAIVPDEVLLDVITRGRPGTPMPAFSKPLSGTLTDQQIEILAKGLKKHFKVAKVEGQNVPRYQVADPAPSMADRAEPIARGEKLFAAACATCHGDEGQGTDGDTPPGAVNDPALLAVLSDQALRRIIITGRPDLGMPSFSGTDGRDADFRPLSEENVDDLLALFAHWRNRPHQVATSPPNSAPR